MCGMSFEDYIDDIMLLSLYGGCIQYAEVLYILGLVDKPVSICTGDIGAGLWTSSVHNYGRCTLSPCQVL